MYYWNRDLCPNISNRVPTSVFNEAYWQSMVTFGVGLGVSGTLDQETDLDSLKSGDLDWPDPTTDATPRGAKIDDLWHASLNSRGDFFSAMDPEIFSEKLGGLLAALVDRKTGTAAAIATNSTRLIDNTLIYQARFDSETWSGQILAYNINSDGSVGEVEWNTNDSGKIPAHGDRRIFTWNGTDGVPCVPEARKTRAKIDSTGCAAIKAWKTTRREDTCGHGTIFWATSSTPTP
jgi:type IV pilus assembly protein PilY1